MAPLDASRVYRAILVPEGQQEEITYVYVGNYLLFADVGAHLSVCARRYHA